MIKLGIVYFSVTGITESLAREIERGASSVEKVEVHSFRIDKKQLVDGRFVDQDILAQLGTCVAIIFGSPTYMGGVASQFKAFGYAKKHLNRLGSQLGVVAHVNGDGLHETDKATANYLGQRVAELAKRMS